MSDFLRGYKVRDPYTGGALNPGAVAKNMPKYPLSRFDKEFIQSIDHQMSRRNKDFTLSTKQYAVIKKLAKRVADYVDQAEAVKLKFGG